MRILCDQMVRESFVSALEAEDRIRLRAFEISWLPTPTTRLRHTPYSTTGSF